jgi:DNA-binding NarL/FixJ family response regulator
VQVGRLLRRQLPDLGIVLLSYYTDPAVLSGIPDAEMAGWSYLSKAAVPGVATLMRAIDGTVAGEIVLDPSMIRPAAMEGDGALAELAPRQLEILGLMAQGYSNRAIAERLALSLKTVQNQINGIYRVLDVDDIDGAIQPRVRAVLAYLRATCRPHGAVPPPS